MDRADPDISTVAFRDYKLFIFFDTRLISAHAADPEVLGMAKEFGRQVRRIWNNSAPDFKFVIYVNYIIGDEPLKSIYGYNVARL